MIKNIFLFFIYLSFSLPVFAYSIGGMAVADSTAYISKVNTLRAKASQHHLAQADIISLHRLFEGLDRVVGRENIIFGFVFLTDYNVGSGDTVAEMYGRVATAFNSPEWGANGITTSSFFSGSWQSRYLRLTGVPVADGNSIASVYIVASAAAGGHMGDAQLRISTASNSASAGGNTSIWTFGNAGTGTTATLNHSFRSLNLEQIGFITATGLTNVPLILTRSTSQVQTHSSAGTSTSTATASTFLGSISSSQTMSIGTRSTSGPGTSGLWTVLLWLNPSVDAIALRLQITSLLNNTVTAAYLLP